jgi:hypothetical protein
MARPSPALLLARMACRSRDKEEPLEGPGLVPGQQLRQPLLQGSMGDPSPELLGQ